MPLAPTIVAAALLVAAAHALAQEPLGRAQWIAAPFSTARDGAESDSSRPMPIFRREFSVRGKVTKAELRIAGVGQFDATLDGNGIGEPGLHQAWTDYRKTITYETYNVTTLLHPGPNVIGVMLGNGMYNVQKTKGRYTKFEGSFGVPKLIAELRLTYADGRSDAIVTDEHWKSAPGPITFSSTYGGEDFDDRKQQANWERPGFNDTAWNAATAASSPGGKLVAAIAPEVQFSEPVRAVKVTEPTNQKSVYDLGRNFAGIPSIRVRGPEGAVLKITPGELLKPDGTVSQTSSAGPMWWSYTLSGSLDGDAWQPRFSYYGFRYLQLEWVGRDPLSAGYAIDEVAGIPLTSASPTAGAFSTSNPLLNQIHSLILAAMHNNEMSLFTDCPHREKLGWLEQDQLNAPGLMFNNDLRGLYAASDRNIADAQHDDGDVPTIAPQYTKFGPAYAIYDDSPEWGSASILAPWCAYKFYGDKSQLALDYPVMQRYLAFLQSKAVDGIVAYGLGDWYDIGPGGPGFEKNTTLGVTATLMLYQDAAAMMQVAGLLGKADDAAHYRALATQEKNAFNARFLDPKTGFYDRGSQTAQAMPLALGIVPDSAKAKVLAQLVNDIQAHEDHTTSGEIGFPYELRALAANGQNELIYRMLNRVDPPSYGSQLAAGATALTEAWDANPKNSQDHFMLGAAEEWFYESLAGIQVDIFAAPNRRITIAPSFPAGLDSASASYASTLGRVAVSWHRDANTITLDATVPVASTLMLPDSPAQFLTPGHHRLTIPVGSGRAERQATTGILASPE